jgi:hypothetical protein
MGGSEGVMGSLCCGYCEIVRGLGRAVVVYTSEKVEGGQDVG